MSSFGWWLITLILSPHARARYVGAGADQPNTIVLARRSKAFRRGAAVQLQVE
jgi:hypothetical protein